MVAGELRETAAGTQRRTAWAFVMRSHLTDITRKMKGPVIEFTVSGTYEECIRELAAELAHFAGERFSKIEIHMSLGHP